MKLFTRVVVLFLIVLWAYASVSKLVDPSHLASAMTRVFGDGVAALLAWVVPVTELVIAGLLLIDAWRKPALMTSAALLVLFTLYIVAVLAGDLKDHPCTCGGLLQALSWRQHLVFNMIVAALHLPALYWLWRRPPAALWKGGDG